MTLARLKGATGRDIAEYLSVRGGFLAGPFSVDRFVLFSSRNSVGGGPYIVEEAYPLLPADATRAPWCGRRNTACPRSGGRRVGLNPGSRSAPSARMRQTPDRRLVSRAERAWMPTDE